MGSKDGREVRRNVLSMMLIVKGRRGASEVRTLSSGVLERKGVDGW